MLEPSTDGLIHLSIDELRSIPLIHLISGMDEDGVASAYITGYTEWISQSAPVVSIGWDWKMVAENKQVRLERVGEPRSNLFVYSNMYKDDQQDKITTFPDGYTNSIDMLCAYVDSLEWHAVTLAHIRERYL
jgi:hypothetical protein